MSYNILIKKRERNTSSKHPIDIYNHSLFIYLRYNNINLKLYEVENPEKEIGGVISEIENGYDYNFNTETFKLK